LEKERKALKKFYQSMKKEPSNPHGYLEYANLRVQMVEKAKE
jgi:hypothetical protein